MRFRDKLARASSRNDSLLCVGLDPKGVPPSSVATFNRAIIEATSDIVCAYKPNLALYDRMKAAGIGALEETLAAVPADIPTIGDAKRGDIENCGQAYAELLYGYRFDAVTVNPFVGYEAAEPFLADKEKGVFVLCRTSNPGAAKRQDGLYTGSDGVQRPYYLDVAREAHDEWGAQGAIGFVIGATAPEALKAVREAYPHTPILVPGVGAQGGPLEAAVENGMNCEGQGLIVNISRSIIYALSQDPSDLEHGRFDGYALFAAEARKAAKKFRDRINRARELSPVLS